MQAKKKMLLNPKMLQVAQTRELGIRMPTTLRNCWEELQLFPVPVIVMNLCGNFHRQSNGAAHY
jgi:hypothetical protein